MGWRPDSSSRIAEQSAAVVSNKTNECRRDLVNPGIPHLHPECVVPIQLTLRPHLVQGNGVSPTPARSTGGGGAVTRLDRCRRYGLRSRNHPAPHGRVRRASPRSLKETSRSTEVHTRTAADQQRRGGTWRSVWEAPIDRRSRLTGRLPGATSRAVAGRRQG